MISSTIQRGLSRAIRTPSSSQSSSLLRLLQRGGRPFSDESGNKTYYDSQSGQHVPVHDENLVSVFLSLEESSRHWDSLDALRESGIGGVSMRSVSTDVPPNVLSKILEKIQAVSPTPDFRFFLPASLEYNLKAKNVVSLLEYIEGEADSLKDSIATLQKQEGSTRSETAILCQDSADGDAMQTATAIANIMDSTRAGDFVFVVGQPTKLGNDIVELAEELSYLDVAGPTVKSRLVIDLSQNTNQEAEEALGDCLDMGVNKFVIDDERLKWIGHFVRDQAGKECAVLGL